MPNEMLSRVARTKEPLDPGGSYSGKLNRTPGKSTATDMKNKIYGNNKSNVQDKVIIQSNTSKIPTSKGAQLGISPRHCKNLKEALNPQKNSPKRKELSPPEKSPLKDKKKIQRMTYVSENSSSENPDMTEEELRDMWDTFSQDQRNNRKYDYLRRMFEPKDQRGQRPSPLSKSPTVSQPAVNNCQEKAGPSNAIYEVNKGKSHNISSTSKINTIKDQDKHKTEVPNVKNTVNQTKKSRNQSRRYLRRELLKSE